MTRARNLRIDSTCVHAPIHHPTDSGLSDDGVRVLTRPFGLAPRVGNCTTLLMPSGLTFGSISALYGPTHGYIDRTAYTILVTVVILSAGVPTMLAQSFFCPRVELGEAGAIISTDAGELADAEIPDEAREVAGALDE